MGVDASVLELDLFRRETSSFDGVTISNSVLVARLRTVKTQISVRALAAWAQLFKASLA